jgi:putative transposase
LLVSVVYLLFRRALAVTALRLRSREFKELEIVVLRHELAVLRRQVARPRLDDADRVFLAAASRFLRGAARQSLFVRPDTVLGWHRRLVRRRWTYAGRRPGRPAFSEDIHELVVRVARENPRWGYQRSLVSSPVWACRCRRPRFARTCGRPVCLRRGRGWARLARVPAGAREVADRV